MWNHVQPFWKSLKSSIRSYKTKQTCTVNSKGIKPIRYNPGGLDLYLLLRHLVRSNTVGRRKRQNQEGKGKRKTNYSWLSSSGIAPADLQKKSSIRRVPAGIGLSGAGREVIRSVEGWSEVCDGTGSESMRKSLVGWCLLAAVLMCSSFTVFRFFSMAISADFSDINWRKSSVEHETRKRASECTLLMSLSSFMIFFTRPDGKAGRIAAAFSCSAINDSRHERTQWRSLADVQRSLGFGANSTCGFSLLVSSPGF